MAAVHEISKDPSKVHTKYKDNMKVSCCLGAPVTMQLG